MDSKEHLKKVIGDLYSNLYDRMYELDENNQDEKKLEDLMSRWLGELEKISIEINPAQKKKEKRKIYQ